MLILVMGVTGSGKSTLGMRLAARLGLAFHDADAFHPPENRAKMAANRPLDDADRWPWLERLAAESAAWEREGGAVLACSALKRAYREVLLGGVARAEVVYLDVPREELERRLDARRGLHEIVRAYDKILDGQFRDLEPPEDAVVVPGALLPNEIVEHAVRGLVRRGVTPRGVVHFAEGGVDRVIDAARATELVDGLLARLGPLRRVLLVPPDFTRAHSGAGELAVLLYSRLRAQAEVDVLPALGTHQPMDAAERRALYPGIPDDRFLVHDFRSGLAALGEVPASFVRAASGGLCDYPIRCEVNARLVEGRYDRILSIGQLVPHEVAGIAGHAKNVLVGAGGKDVIDRTHFLGAVAGMEACMGRVASPVRDVLSYMAAEFLARLPITYLMTVRGRDASGGLVTRGLFAGDDDACYFAAAPLVRACNVELLAEAPAKVVVHLDGAEFKSTWLGNKAIYRTRLAIADGGELLVLGPGVRSFGEDPAIDRLIRRHGYRGTRATLNAVNADPELAGTLSAAAHLIHGSSEGRFRIRYATGGLSAAEIAGVGYEPADLAESLARYDPAALRDGWNELDGERFFYVSNPAYGLWAEGSRFGAA